MNLGYACINMTLSQKKIGSNRTCRRQTFQQKGLRYISELALLNVQDLERIVHWNTQNGINVFRMSSEIMPWWDHYEWEQLPDYARIAATLKRIGDFATANNQRLSFHPGPFTLLASSNASVIDKSIAALECHSRFMDLLGVSATPFNKINIHVGGAYGNKTTALDNWCRNFERLSDNCRSRMTIENDDKDSMYGPMELYESIHKRIGIPIVFDYHHFPFRDNGLTEAEALELCLSTWPDGVRPITHYSESKALHENNSKLKPQAHSDYVDGPIRMHGFDFDIMIEAKAKELAVLKLRNSIKIN